MPSTGESKGLALTPRDCIAAAAGIGRRIAEQARWQGERCTWEIKVLAGGPGLRTEAATAGPELYQGSSGIAWFLGELFHRTGEEAIRRAAAGGILHALGLAADLPPASFGFHGGRVGVAWAAARLALLLGPRPGRERLQKQAWEVLQPLRGREAEDRGVDVIAGAAGAIPALLELATLLDRREPLEIARRLGEALLDQARPEPGGWSWQTLRGTSARNLLGLAHGASGAGLALLELARATGDGRFRFAAEMAFLYERQFFDREASNWPDLRDQQLGEQVRSGRLEAIRRAARAGWEPGYELHFMTAWCHGSPGIGLARLRAYQLTGEERYLEEARAALRSTLPSIQGEALEAANFSLCHGTAGNCELPLAAAEVLGEPELRRVCLRAAEHGLRSFGRNGGPWPCGTLTSEADPSLMIGEAGIGLFFLRLAAGETPDREPPSPLLLRPLPPADDGGPPPGSDDGYQALRREAEAGYFASTSARWARLGANSAGISPEGDEAPLSISPPALLYGRLRARLEACGQGTELLEDAFRLDRARFELAAEPSDFTREFVRTLARRPWDEVEPRQASFELAPGAALVETRWDWQAWDDGSPRPPRKAAYHLLLRTAGQVAVRRVGPFAYLVLDAVRRPATLEEVLRRVAAALETAADPELVRAQVLPQIEQLYRAGALDLAKAPPETGGREGGGG